MLVRRVLGNDTIVNEYFKGQYFTYKDFLEVKELCDLPEYDETSELLDELGAHLKEPKSAVVMKELMIEVMTDDLVEFKAGKREAALLNVKSKFSAYNFKKIRIPQFSETRFGSFVGLFSCFYVYKQ